MNRTFVFPVAILVCCLPQYILAQAALTISKPAGVFKDNVMEISYTIVNGGEGNEYSVELLVWDQDGRIIMPGALTGDVGSGVRGNGEKRMEWDLGKDRLFLHSRIYFEISAKLANPARGASQVISTPAEMNLASSSRTENEKNVTLAGIVGTSLVFPGTGMSRITGKPHWIRGIAGYSFLAGAAFFNFQSIRTYDQITDYTGFETRQDQLRKSVRQDQFSEILAFSAIGIWVSDLVWNVAGWHRYNQRSSEGPSANIRVEPGFDPNTLLPTVGLRVLF